MKLCPPSWGFVYLAAVIAACAAFFVFVTGRFWFDEGDPSARLRGEASYLYRLAANSTGAQRWRWMNEALPLCFGSADAAKVATLLGELNGAGIEPRLDPGAMVIPAVWASGLTDDGWTLGTQTALLVAHNAGAAPASLVLHWRGPPNATRACFRRWNGLLIDPPVGIWQIILR